MSIRRPGSGSGKGTSRGFHPFKETNDPGLMAAASGGVSRAISVNEVAVTTGFLRSTRCAVPGCGRPREDPVHFPADDE